MSECSKKVTKKTMKKKEKSLERVTKIIKNTNLATKSNTKKFASKVCENANSVTYYNYN